MAVRVRAHGRRPPETGAVRVRRSAFDFLTAACDELDRAERGDVAGQIERADERVRLAADVDARDAAVEEARRLRMTLLSQLAQARDRRSPVHLALALDSYAKTSELSASQLDELIAAIEAAGANEGEV